MSSKTVPEPVGSHAGSVVGPRAWSLAGRLAAWNALTSFALILAATSLMYWVLSQSLGQDDGHLLADKVREIVFILRSQPFDARALRHEVEEEWSARRFSPVFVRVLDHEGRVLAAAPDMDASLPRSAFPAPSPDLDDFVDHRTADGRTFQVLSLACVIGQDDDAPDCVIQAAMDRSAEVALLGRYRERWWLVLALGLVLSAVVGFQVARRGIRPIHAVADTARRISPANFGERIRAEGLPAELVDLAGTFNQMLDRLERSFARLSQFSADIAHELRTPVNNLQGEIEVALGKPRAVEEYRDVLGSSLEECGRLSRLIDTLLFLARTENPGTQLVTESLDLGVELAAIREFYEATAHERGVALAVEVARDVRVTVNRPLLQRAVGNLVANAIAHTKANGTVTIAGRVEGATSLVVVSDTGCGIPTEHVAHVFDRFYRVDATRSSSGGSVGLGLAIVKSIMDLHGGVARIDSEPGRGTRVTLAFAAR